MFPDGNIEGIVCGSVPKMSCTIELIARNMPRVTITTFSGLRPTSTGRMSTRSMIAPPMNEMTMDSRTARTTGMPVVVNFHDEVGREQRHLALGEVQQAGRPEDEDERQGDRRVDDPVADAVEDLGDEEVDVHDQNPRYALRTPSSPLSDSAGPSVTIRPVSST